MTPNERKERLGHGGLSRVAKRLKVTLGHVSEVNRGHRTDLRVQREITRRITERYPEIQAVDVWPVAATPALAAG